MNARRYHPKLGNPKGRSGQQYLQKGKDHSVDVHYISSPKRGRGQPLEGGGQVPKEGVLEEKKLKRPSEASIKRFFPAKRPKKRGGNNSSRERETHG